MFGENILVIYLAEMTLCFRRASLSLYTIESDSVWIESPNTFRSYTWVVSCDVMYIQIQCSFEQFGLPGDILDLG